MKSRRFFLLMAGVVMAATQAMAQSYYDDDIYYDPQKDEQAKAEKAAKKAAKEAQKRYEAEARLAGQFDAADLFASQANGTRTISVDDYNRRGIFAVDSVLAADSTRSDFEYTRRIEQFYNPAIADLVNADEEVANIYYVEPQTVNLYVNTPSSYWGYDYFASPYYSPYYSWNFGWGAPSWGWNWGWNTWYGPSWSWGWGPSWAWGPSWGCLLYTTPNPRAKRQNRI
nr:hypothetical protein [Duncaniella sp.]